jgi:hypothetical protein
MTEEKNIWSSFIDTLHTDQIIAQNNKITLKGDLEIEGDLNLKGNIERNLNNHILFDKEINFSSDSQLNINSGITIHFAFHEKEYIYKITIIFNEGEYIYCSQFIYNKKKQVTPKIISKFLIKYDVEMLIQDQILNKLIIKERNNLDLNDIYSLRIKIEI